jgi:hypothetical protein
LEVIRDESASILESNKAKVMSGLLRLQKLDDHGKWIALDIALDGLQQALLCKVLDERLNKIFHAHINGMSDQFISVYVQSLVFESFND